jgi:hypothetical protein
VGLLARSRRGGRELARRRQGSRQRGEAPLWTAQHVILLSVKQKKVVPRTFFLISASAAALSRDFKRVLTSFQLDA